MSSSDSERTASDQVYISENAQSSSSSSPRNSNIIIDLEETETSSKNSLDLTQKPRKSQKNKKPKIAKKSIVPGKYLKIYDSQYQEWVDVGSSPSTSSVVKSTPNP